MRSTTRPLAPSAWICRIVRIVRPVSRWVLNRHDDVIKWKHFPCYWPFVRGIHRWPVNSPHKGQWHRALVFSLICAGIKPGLYSMRVYTRAYANCRRSCSVASCAQRIRAHTPTVAVKVQICWTFKASADQRRHSSQSRKRSKVTEGRCVVLHRDIYGRIPTHTLTCLYFYPRRNLRYAVAMHRQPQAWTSARAAGCQRISAHGV